MSLQIKEMPNTERPRERALKYGMQALSDTELLAILLRTGKKGSNAKDVALEILHHFDDIGKLRDASISTLAKIDGVGNAKALSILSAIELGKRVVAYTLPIPTKITNAQDIYALLHLEVENEKQEKFICVFLDTKKNVIKWECIFEGTANRSIVHAREVFHAAVKYQAVYLIIVHNHPSGDPTPSKADIILTENLKECGKMIDIPIIDHVIIGKNKYYSFYDHERS